MSILIFFLVLFVLILVHEFGHFVVAKKTGMRVDEFGIGFPPKLFGIKKGETEYTFNALPIGGFVRIYGENAEDVATDSTASIDISSSFTQKSKLSQALVLIAGVSMNIIFAWFLFFVVLIAGVPTVVDENEATEEARLVVTLVLENSPAQIAGIPQGAVITSLKSGVDTNVTLSPTSFREFTESHGGQEMLIEYTSGSKTFEKALMSEKEVIESDLERPAVGVALALVDNVNTPFYIAIWDATKMTASSLVAITVGISTLLYDAVLGQADFSQIAGPVGIVGLVGEASAFGFMSLLMFTAFISLNLAVINMLPFPALDGGRLLFVAIETVTKKQINPKWVMKLNTFGFLLLILLMVVVTWSDISKIL